MAENNKRKRFIINVLYWVLITALVYVGFKYFIPLIWPFFLAFIFAWILRPLIRLLTAKCHVKYKLSVTICLIVFFALLGGIIVGLSARIISLATDAIGAVPGLYASTIKPGLGNLASQLEGLAKRLSPDLYSLLSTAFPDFISSIGTAVTDLSMKAVSALTGWVTKVPRRLLNTLICVIATVFMTASFPRITAFLMRQLPRRRQLFVRETADSLKSVILEYGKSYGIIMGITFAEIFAGLLFIGQKNALLIAVAIAAFDIFPIVGAGMILLPWAIVTMFTGAVAKGVGLLALYIIVVVVRQIIEPKIVGRHVGLHPLVTLMAMFVGTKLFGGIGLFGLPIACAIIKSLNDGGIIHLIKKEQLPEPPEPEQENAE
jgi:sporulation integral membrane protein YtvI